MTEIYYNDIQVGDAMPTFTSDPVSRTHLVRYAGASGDFNPLHHDETFVKLFGLPRVIAHGMLIMGITSRAITDWIPNKYIKKFGVRFSGMTEPVDIDNPGETAGRATITVTGKIVEKMDSEKKIRCEIQATDALGGVKLTGSFIAVLPSK
jgi:acyl dehydratase